LFRFDFELEDSSGKLDSDGFVGDKSEVFLQSDQGAKLSFGVSNVEISILQDDFSVFSGN